MITISQCVGAALFLCRLVSHERVCSSGKTLTALAYIAATGKRALVVTPKRVVEHWVCEAKVAFPDYFDGRVFTLGTHIKRGTESEALSFVQDKARLVCLNYELLERFLPFLADAGLDTIILDESHYIKNSEAKRTRLLLDSKDAFEQKLLLSGTPIKNRVDELVTQLEFIGMKNAETVEEMSPGKLWNTLQESNLYLRRSIKAGKSNAFAMTIFQRSLISF